MIKTLKNQVLFEYKMNNYPISNNSLRFILNATNTWLLQRKKEYQKLLDKCTDTSLSEFYQGQIKAIQESIENIE